MQSSPALQQKKTIENPSQERCYLVFGTENYKSKVMLESEEEPIKLGKDILNQKEDEKYFGDVLCSLGLT